MPTLTSNFDFNLPLINNATDADLWGGYLNANWTALDALIPKTTASKSSTFNVGATEFNYTYLVDASSGAVTADLPAVANVYNGFTVRFKLVDATNALTIDPNGSETIDGASTLEINVEDEVVGVVCDGTGWHALKLSIATQAQAEAGTANNVLMTPLRTQQFFDNTVEVYTSTDQTITSSGTLNLSHGLSATPTIVQARLVCQSDELGYSAGDVLLADNHIQNGGGSGVSRGQGIVPDATNINVYFGSNSSAYDIIRKDTRALASITNTNWKLRITAILLN